MTPKEIEDLSQKSNVILELDVMAFLKMIQAKAIEWKTKMVKG